MLRALRCFVVNSFPAVPSKKCAWDSGTWDKPGHVISVNTRVSENARPKMVCKTAGKIWPPTRDHCPGACRSVGQPAAVKKAIEH